MSQSFSKTSCTCKKKNHSVQKVILAQTSLKQVVRVKTSLKQVVRVKVLIETISVKACKLVL